MPAGPEIILPLGTVLKCDEGHLWIYVGTTTTTISSPLNFIRVGTAGLARPYMYHATHKDTLYKKFPALKTGEYSQYMVTMWSVAAGEELKRLNHQVRDLSMMVRKMTKYVPDARKLKKHVIDYMVRNDLQGSPFRKEDAKCDD